MKKLIIFILFLSPFFSNGQNIKELFKFGTIYGAINGNTSISDVDVYSVTNGLETQTIKTPFDYSVLLGVRKIRQFGYQPKEAFKRGTESSFSDAATIGRWEDKIEFLFQGEFKREDGFADVEYFEASQRYRKQLENGVSLNIGIAQRMSEPYGYDPLEEWLLSNGNLHYTQLAIQEGYTMTFDGNGGVEYFDPSGNSVATSTEVWEAVAIPAMLANYTEKKRNQLPVQWTHSWVVGFDYYKYSKTSWLHVWGSLMPLHYSDEDNQFSYYNFNEGQWKDYSGGIVFGHWFSKNIGIFIEGNYNKYWNRTWHGFSTGINYRVF